MQRFLFAAPLALILVSCTGIHIAPHAGFTNTNPAQEYGTIAVLATGGGLYHSNRVPGQIANAGTAKSGEACSHSVLWLVAWGDSSLNAARKAGQIQKIGLVEYDVRAIFGFFYHRFCTIVRGE